MKCSIHIQKTLVANVHVPLFVAAACAVMGLAAMADVQDVTITTSGTIQFIADGEYGSIVNAASGEVALTSSGGVVEADAISATNFDAAVVGATTVLDGGWWDFGVSDPSADTVNFMTKDSTLANRSVTLDNGAVVTNVGWAYLAGTGGKNNSLALDGASTLSVNALHLGCSASAGQNSKVTVGSGSLLNVFGRLSLSDGEIWKNNKANTGNELVVSGAGSRLVVGGETSLGRALSGNYATPGGSTFKVVDGATATLNALVVSAGSTWHGDENHVVFGKDAHVTMTAFSFGAGGSASATGVGKNMLEILDGAVVTNTGAFTFGVDHASSPNNLMVISNATFYSGSHGSASSGRFLVKGRESELRISGPNAKFLMGEASDGFFYGAGNSFVVENGAEYALPCGSYCYTREGRNETIRFCAGATVTRSGNFGTGDSNSGLGVSNKLEIVSGASFTVGDNGYFRLVGDYSSLLVDDASLSVASSLYVGTNGLSAAKAKGFVGQTFRIAGSHPYVRVGWDIAMDSDVTLAFALPASGYDSGFATADKPVVYGGGNNNHRLSIAEGSTVRFVFENARAFLRSHKVKHDYVLIKGYNASYLEDLTPERLVQMSEGLPDGLMLEKTVVGNSAQLILHVRPKRGMLIRFL